MLTALATFAGLVIGAVLQYVFTTVLEERRHFRKMRTQAYVDYLKAWSEVTHHTRKLNAETRAREARLTDAETRIILYGSESVVEHVVKRVESKSRKGEATAVEGLLKEMRKDVSSSNDGLDIRLRSYWSA